MSTNVNADEVMIIENPEVLTGHQYVGEIISTHTGFVFIHNVRRGYETIGTNGDVFCPVPTESNFEVGQLVQFSELNPDKDRIGKFRTETISKINMEIIENTPEGRMTAIVKLSNATSPYHQLKKMINDDDLTKAGQNQPLAEFIQQIAYILNQGSGYDPLHVNVLAEDFVKKTFSMLTPLGVKCSIMDDVDKVAERRMIEENIALYNENELHGQAESLKNEYAQFAKVREAFTLMHNNGLLSYSSVLDIKHLPELSFAFPVWFIHAKNGFVDETSENDPQPSNAAKFFADSIESREFAWFHQVYNRRTRPLSQFRGKDIMPPNMVHIMREAKELFDYVVIMTPYHDLASREWSDPNWLRNIDPVMVGFLNGLPNMFILGRWSSTGIFPLLLDCIADTANHLKLNKHLLRNFNNSTYWYKGMSGGNLGGSDNLINYVDHLLLAYDRGLLFPFLRGELKDDPEYKFPE